MSAYIGHSEGTSQMFIGASLKPDYFESKLDLYVALAPIVRLDHTLNGLMKAASQFVGVIGSVVQSLHLYNLMPRNPVSSDVMGAFCH